MTSSIITWARAATRHRLAGFLLGNVGAQFASLAIALLIARLVNPHEFGTYGIFLAVCTLGSALLLSRLDSAVAMSRDLDVLVVSLRLSFVFIIVCGLTIAPAALAALFLWGIYIKTPMELICAGGVILSASLYQVSLMAAASGGFEKIYSIGRIFNVVSIGIFQIGSTIGDVPLPLIVGHGMGQLVAVLWISFSLRSLYRRHRTTVVDSGLTEHLKRFFFWVESLLE